MTLLKVLPLKSGNIMDNNHNKNMKIKIKQLQNSTIWQIIFTLLLLTGMSIILGLFLTLEKGFMIIFGLFFVTFFPGYCLSFILFPKSIELTQTSNNKGLDIIERIITSIFTSVTVNILVLFILRKLHFEVTTLKVIIIVFLVNALCFILKFIFKKIKI